VSRRVSCTTQQAIESAERHKPLPVETRVRNGNRLRGVRSQPLALASRQSTVTNVNGGLRVFLSHTDELAHYPQDRSYVAAAEEAVKLFRGAAIDMKYMAARGQNSADHCRELLGDSDVYVGIIGFRYGSLVPEADDSGRSFTEFEFDVATDLELERLVFLLHQDANVPAKILFENRDDYERQQRFRERLQNVDGVTWKWVANPDDLTKRLLQSLNEFALRRNAVSPTAEQGSDANPGITALDMASTVQKQLQGVLYVLRGAAATVEQVEHSYAEPARMSEWKSIDDKIKKHKELAESAMTPATVLKSSLEEAAREAEHARKSVGKLGENWPAEHTAELTSIIDTISDLQGVSEQLLEKVATSCAELERRTFYSRAYQSPRELLSQAYELVDATNAITIRMKRTLSRPYAAPRVSRAPDVPPVAERTPRDAPTSPGLGWQETPATFISADWQAAAGAGAPSEAPAPDTAAVPSDLVHGKVVAVKVQGDSMEGAGVRDGDYVIMRRQSTAQDRDIVIVATWEADDPEYGQAKVKRYREQPGEDPYLESEYADRKETIPIGPSDRIAGKVIGIFRSVP
jgi:SOS-response transcriptional repressor LexA